MAPHSRRARRRARSTSDKLKDCCRVFTAFVFSNVGIVVLFVAYAIVGAIIFQKIEGEGELVQKFRVKAMRSDTVQQLWNITRRLNVMFEGNWTELVDEKILEFQNNIVLAVGDGYDGKAEMASQWTFSGGFLYSLTVMTTIGYGNIAPRTPMGKVVTIFYTCVGFPLFLLYLSNIGSIMAISFKWLYAKMCKCRPPARAAAAELTQTTDFSEVEAPLGAVYGASEATAWADDVGSGSTSRSRADETTTTASTSSGADGSGGDDGDSSDATSSSGGGGRRRSRLDLSTITVPISMCLVIMAVYICGGAMFFARLEQWDFLTSCYFCFISLSTIGFGDYVPGDSIRSSSGGVEVGFVLTSMYLMVGMAIIAMCFNLMQEEVIQKVRGCAKCLGCLRDAG